MLQVHQVQQVHLCNRTNGASTKQKTSMSPLSVVKQWLSSLFSDSIVFPKEIRLYIYQLASVTNGNLPWPPLSLWYIRCPVSLEQITSWEEKQEPPTFIKEPGQNTRKKTTDQTTQGYGCREAAPLPALLDRLQHQLLRPSQLLPHHPAHQEKPVHFLWHTSCPFPYWRCEYLGKNYFILSTRNTRLV